MRVEIGGGRVVMERGGRETKRRIVIVVRRGSGNRSRGRGPVGMLRDPLDWDRGSERSSGGDSSRDGRDPRRARRGVGRGFGVRWRGELCRIRGGQVLVLSTSRRREAFRMNCILDNQTKLSARRGNT
jgi:hypothetical protein